MNIKTQGISFFQQNNGLKSTQERMERQAKRDNQVAFFEKQKENLKNMKADTLDDISRKLELLHGYNDQIAAAKQEYNNSQMFHAMDEARERAEKIKEEAEKYAPKTPEERLEEMVEEATGVDKDAGMLSDVMDELTEVAEEMQESLEDEMEEATEMMEGQLSDSLSELDAGTVQEGITGIKSIEDLSDTKVFREDVQWTSSSQNEEILNKYKQIDIRI